MYLKLVNISIPCMKSKLITIKKKICFKHLTNHAQHIKNLNNKMFDRDNQKCCKANKKNNLFTHEKQQY